MSAHDINATILTLLSARAPFFGGKQTTIESKPERGPGGDPLRPVRDAPPAPGPRS